MKKYFVAAALAVASLMSMNAQTVVLEENFDALEAVDPSTGLHIFGKNAWTGTDAEGVSYQPNYTTYMKAVNAGTYPDFLHGWSSRSTYLYACQGFVRISKTSYGGDLLSPKFAALTEATDVEATWDGIGYTSAITLDENGDYSKGGVHDYQAYCVGVIGAGEIQGETVDANYVDADGNKITVKAAVINIPTDAFINPLDTLEAWGKEGIKARVKIKGATAETQLAIFSTGLGTTPAMGGDYPEMATDAPHATNSKVNRVVIDNIKIVTAPGSGVNDVNSAKAVARVSYFNLQGMESATPFDGMNIVKTVYTDGSNSVAKMMK